MSAESYVLLRVRFLAFSFRNKLRKYPLYEILTNFWDLGPFYSPVKLSISKTIIPRKQSIQMCSHIVQWNFRQYCLEVPKQYIFRIPIFQRCSSTKKYLMIYQFNSIFPPWFLGWHQNMNNLGKYHIILEGQENLDWNPRTNICIVYYTQ